MPTNTLYTISTEWQDYRIWDISTNIKCGSTNVLAVDTSELTNRRRKKTILYVWLGWYRIRVEVGKYWVPPVSRRAPPSFGVDICVFEGSGWHGSIQYKRSRQTKIKWTGKGRGINYNRNYLQKKFCGKRKTGDSLPLSKRRGGMQHHIFMATPAEN